MLRLLRSKRASRMHPAPRLFVHFAAFVPSAPEGLEMTA